MSFAARLWSAVDAKRTPAMVGLDPRVERLPASFRARAAAGGSAAAAALIDYHRALLQVIAPHVAVVKPQAAFFELVGAAGWRALADAIDAAHELGLLVVLDAKRGDIGSTSEAYAAALLRGGLGGCSFPRADALTVNPYLGEDACLPFREAALAADAGLFVLVRTSNPGSNAFQQPGDPPVHDRVAGMIHSWSTAALDDHGWSPFGAVVGATRAEELGHFRALLPHSPLLLPGFGFQGGAAEGLAAAFDERGHGAIVNASRSILWAHERADLSHLPSWEERVERALIEMIGELRRARCGPA